VCIVIGPSSRFGIIRGVSAEFLLTTLVVVATPGTGVLYTLAAGLAALLHTSALAFQVLKYLGVAYLLYMAWTTIRDKTDLAVGAAEPLPAGKVIASGVLINLLNPKLTLFFFAFLPQFVSTAEPNAALRMAALSGVFMLVTFAVFAVYGVFAAGVRRHVISRPAAVRWMRRAFGSAFVALAGRLAVTDR
jgi:threonine/homoserine/homoserine lactone efflux protein